MRTMSQDELKMIFDRDMWVCQYRDVKHGKKCNRRATEPAHKISQGKGGRQSVKEYFLKEFNVDLNGVGVDMVIHHEFNAKSCCDNKVHNSFWALNPVTNKLEIAELMESIYKDLVQKEIIGR